MEEDEDIEKRFYCDSCGHNFAMEVDEDMPEPKFCIFCGAPVYVRDDEHDDYQTDY
jgi:rRNA maturation endonuclease Nob1